MSVQFCVLGSGSQGNAALVMTAGCHVLIDAGFFPDDLARRMEGTGASWETLDAVVLTHTHGDHLKKKCLTSCAEHDVRFICHERHLEQLSGGRYFKKLQQRNLVQTYDGSGPIEISRCLRFHPIPLPHDCPPTYGFRIEARGAYLREDQSNNESGTLEERWVKLGYLADLGVCAEETAHAVADVDLLALEFNHDEQMERNSGRHPRLIERVLGQHGHLSNRQAAEAFHQVLTRCSNGGPKLLVQMHLSRECNRAELAYQAAQEVLLMTGAQTRVFSTRQEQRGTIHAL